MIQLYENMIGLLLKKGFGSVDGWFSGEDLSALRKALLLSYDNNSFRQAGIGNKSNYTEQNKIRGDQIHWLNKESKVNVEKIFFQKLDGFVNYLNQTCYTGISNHEFHYAIYAAGTFYQKHIDQFNSDDKRKYSLVLYLNENWKIGDGGELVIYSGIKHIVEPVFGRIVFFSSNLEHEVLLTKVQRLSLTGWLKTS